MLPPTSLKNSIGSQKPFAPYSSENTSSSRSAIAPASVLCSFLGLMWEMAEFRGKSTLVFFLLEMTIFMLCTTPPVGVEITSGLPYCPAGSSASYIRFLFLSPNAKT